MKPKSSERKKDLEDKTILGSYLPLGLMIHLNEEVPIVGESEISLNSGQTFLTLFHEYQHYLQDTTTISGMMCFVSFWRAVFSIVKINSTKQEIYIPIQDKGVTGTPEADFHKNIMVAIRGINESVEESSEIVDIKFNECRSVASRDKTTFPLPAVYLTLKHKNKTSRYEFGSRDIREFLAASMDERLSCTNTTLSEFPYRTVLKVARFFSAKASVPIPDIKNLVVFSDASLMTTAPGYFTAKYIQEYCDNSNQDTYAVVDKVNKKMKFRKDDCIARLEKDLEAGVDVMSSSDKKKTMLQWFKEHFSRSFKLRREQPDYFIRTHLSSDPWPAVNDILKEFPMPAITYKGENFISFDIDGSKQETNDLRDIGPYFTALIYAVDVLTNHRTNMKCDLLKSCGQIFKCQDCENKPWVHANRSSTCAVGSAFAALHLKEKKIKV